MSSATDRAHAEGDQINACSSAVGYNFNLIYSTCVGNEADETMTQFLPPRFGRYLLFATELFELGEHRVTVELAGGLLLYRGPEGRQQRGDLRLA